MTDAVFDRELAHVHERVEKLEESTKERLDNHGTRLRTVEEWQIAFEATFKTERKTLVAIVSIGVAIGSGIVLLVQLWLDAKGG